MIISKVLVAAAVLATVATSVMAGTLYVNGSCGSDAWTGREAECSGPDGPKATIQAALDAALHYDTIVVYPGVYAENISFNGKVVEVRSLDPQDSTSVSATVIDGGGNEAVVTFSGTEWSFAAIRGLTIRNGDAVAGGGVNGNGTLATVSSCVIDGNLASWQGGGLYNLAGLISDCTITNNVVRSSSSGYGGGLAVCSGTIANCLIRGNRAESWSSGGGLASCNGDIVNCQILENFAQMEGGGVYLGRGTFFGCEIRDNIAQFGGGLYGSSGPLTNCIIAGNAPAGLERCCTTLTHCTIAENRGHGLYNSSGGTARLVNCILAGNYPYAVSVGRNDTVEADHCCIPGGRRSTYASSGGTILLSSTVTTDPQFALPDDYHVQEESPCVDQGTDAGVPADLEGRPRPLGDAVDIGAYEFTPDGAAIAVDPREIVLRGTEGEMASDAIALHIRNCGSGTLAWSVAADANWVRVDPTASTTEDLI